MTTGLQAMLERVEGLHEKGAFTKTQAAEWRKTARGAYRSFQQARNLLGDAADEYDSLREEYIHCRRFGHPWGDFHFIGMSVGGGFGLTYQSMCTRCGMVTRRYKKPNGAANGGPRYDFPSGYSIGGVRLRRTHVEALEAIAELDSFLCNIETQHAARSKKTGAKRSHLQSVS